jgi:hypothetical protein
MGVLSGQFVPDDQCVPDDKEYRLMCSPAVCNRCKKITWTGCGQHVDQALAGVPADERCTCR